MPTSGGVFRYAWSVVCWIVLSGLVAGVLAALYYVPRANAELRRFVEVRLATLYPELKVDVGAAKFVKGQGIQLQNLSLSWPQQRNGQAEIAAVETLTLQCDASLPALLKGSLSIHEVTLQGLVLNVEQTRGGHINLEKLIPAELPPCQNGTLPRVRLQRTTVRYAELTAGAAKSLEIEDLDLDVRFKRIGSTADMLVAFDGACRSAFCQQLEVEGGVRTTDGAWTVRGRLQGVDLSSHLLSQLPSRLSQQVRTSAAFRGRVDCEFEAHGDRATPPRLSVSGQVKEGSWQDPEWPQAVSNLNADFRASRTGFDVQNLTAYYGAAKLAGSVSCSGYDKTAPLDVQLSFGELSVTPTLIHSFPAKLQTAWQKLQYTGIISGDIQYRFDGEQHAYTSELQFHDVTLQHHRFPYPVANCTGSVRLSDAEWQFELEGNAGETKVTMLGALRDPGPGHTGWWEVKSLGWKSIDEELTAALPAAGQQLVREMDLRGQVGFLVRAERKQPYLRTPADIIVKFAQVSMNYVKFPYPVNQIRGELRSTPRGWEMQDFVGRNDTCDIRCNGYWDSQDPDAALQLDFDMNNVRLDAALRQALPPKAQKSWADLRPSGVVDRVAVRLFKTRAMPNSEIDIRIDHHPRANDNRIQNSLAVYPTWFPLQLSNVQGKARLRGNSLLLQGVEADHGRIRFRTNGTGSFRDQNGWEMNLTECAVDRVEFSETVLAALPPTLRRALRRMQSTGIYSLYGALNFARQGDTQAVSSGWDVIVNVEQGSLDIGLPVNGIFGAVRLHGSSYGAQTWSRGQLKLDSAMLRRVQLTNIEGPLLIDSSRVSLGQHAPPESGTASSLPITAQVYQGRISTNATVAFTKDQPFRVDLSLRDTNVALMARDWQLGQGNVAGRGQLDLTLHGSTRGRHTYVGNGRAQLRDGNLYELPLVLALLNRLGSGRTDNAAFTTSDIAFHIDDGFVYFDQFDLSGDAVTLKGIGEMSLDRQLSLDFYSIMGREQRWSPLVRPFLGEASRQFLQIHVNGTLSNPQTTQEVLPGLNERLQQLFPEQPAEPDPRQAAGRMLLPSLDGLRNPQR